MANILIIGGSYFAGRVLVEELCRDPNHDVVVYNRGNLPLPKAPCLTQLQGDRTQAADIRSVIPARHWDAVIDFCAYGPDDVRTLLDNLPGRAAHYLLLSTTSVYRPTPARLSEEAALLTQPDPAQGAQADYAFQKRLTEQAAEALCSARALPLTIVRPAMIYGFYNYAEREKVFFDALIDKRPLPIPTESSGRYSMIWVVDLANLLIRCLNNPLSHGQVFNAAGPEAVSYALLLRSLEQILGKPCQVVHYTPAQIRDERPTLPFPPDLQLLYSGALAGQRLGLTYTPLRQGLRAALAHYVRCRRAVRQRSNYATPKDG